MDPHNDFDKHDRAPYDIAPATNETYAAMRQERDNLRRERDELSELVGRYALEFETLCRRWINAESSLGGLQRWRMSSTGLDPHLNGEWVRHDALITLHGLPVVPGADRLCRSKAPALVDGGGELSDPKPLSDYVAKCRAALDEYQRLRALGVGPAMAARESGLVDAVKGQA